MVVSESTLKWVMRFYPPLLFQRIWVVKFYPGFRGVKVRIKKSLLNNNYNRSIFGGTIFSAADPFYPVLFHQLFGVKGYRVIVWLKSSQVQYLKPARTALEFDISITDEDVADMEAELIAAGKFVRTYPIDMFDKNGVHCAALQCEVYVRHLDTTVAKTPVNESNYER